MTSPPGVMTDQLVLAGASPPTSLTSLSMIMAARWFAVTSVSVPACGAFAAGPAPLLGYGEDIPRQ